MRRKKRVVCIVCGRLMVYNRLCKPCAKEMDRKACQQERRVDFDLQERSRIIGLAGYDRPAAVKRVNR